MLLAVTAMVFSDYPFTEKEITEKALNLTSRYFQDFAHPETFVLYGGRLSTKDKWKYKIEDIKAGKPDPWGYGSRIEDTGLHCGHMLGAFLDAYAARPDPEIAAYAKKMYSALKFIYECSPVPGLVPRGPHPDDKTALYTDSSMDQHTTYIISMAMYALSPLATAEEKSFIKKSLDETGKRLKKYDYSIKQPDGVTEAHVGFSWLGFNSSHAQILLPTVYALFKGTADDFWKKEYERLADEETGKRWEFLKPGEHITLNGHPIYANQNCFRGNAFYRMLGDPQKKEIIRGLLTQCAEMQMAREYPNDFFYKFSPAEKWEALAKECGWPGSRLVSAEQAAAMYKPEFLAIADWQVRAMAKLAHIRFPLGGYHMIVTSENEELIKKYLPVIWSLMNNVDLTKIDDGETNYIFSAIAWHLYSFYFLHK
ncbi:MAG: hypothetical protein A2096_08645 [Spirochaetes bacterium GWF1_41_5]|nr:MAG: hypothetical protein A2096_08645 [Spirochaetes bacterium GWF1_41_5]